MTPDELRALADALEPMSGAPRFEGMNVLTFCKWLRACADAQPVAWSDGLGSFIEADEKVGDDPDILAYRVPLYAAPVPPQREAQGCIVESYSSRMCERGTCGCVVTHGIGGSDAE